MARLQWALTCRDFSIDGNTNNITYRDAIEQIRAEEFPAQIPPIVVVAIVWRRNDIETPETFNFRVVVEDKNQEEALTSETTEVNLKDYERFRAHVPNPPMEVEDPGTVWFGIEKDEGDGWERVWDLPVELKTLEDEEQENPEAEGI